MPLEEYQRKRDFTKTPEPSGSKGKPWKIQPFEGWNKLAKGKRFCVQMHRATRLHFDLRLEHSGVLLSWAVPQGPPLDPAKKRLAMHVEDHPLDYGEFEGVIPEGYGAGTVMLWDAGTFEFKPFEKSKGVNIKNIDDGLRAGELKFFLSGSKLRGEFALIQLKKDNPEGKAWLLIKKKDEGALPGIEAKELDVSVKSGKSLEEIAGSSGGDPREQKRRAKHRDSEAADVEAQLAKADAKAADLQVEGKTVHITNLDKLYWPAEKITKRDFIAYYLRMGKYILPYLQDRPLSMHIMPNGIEGKEFWRKQKPSHTPDWITSWTYHGQETKTYIVVNDLATLIWVANAACIDLHPWHSRIDESTKPDWAVFDLDPFEPATFADVIQIAKLIKSALDHYKLKSVIKTSGQTGLQIYVPLERGPNYKIVSAWVKEVGYAIAEVVPEKISWKWHVAERTGQIRIDYTQNNINKTIAAPYSLRPAVGAPVSTPIAWEELDDKKLRPDLWNIKTIEKRVAEVGDLFAPLLTIKQSLPKK